MPGVLPNLYCSVQDIFDAAGLEGVQLRLDDRNQASGQPVSTTADAAVGAASLTVVAIQYALPRGSVLVFDMAGLAAPVQAVLTAAAAAAAVSLAVGAIATAIPSGSVAIDNGVNVWEAALPLKGCKYATAQVKSYCCGRYDDSVLVNSWSVNRWATALALRWVAKRRCQVAPAGIESDYKESIEELKAVQSGQLNIEDIGTRTSGWPFLSNVSMDDRYTFRKVRVESMISESTPTQYSQSIDWSSLMGFFEW